ncbi:MAG: tetratricopeptide repeat protein [Bacteroidota bacterium]
MEELYQTIENYLDGKLTTDAKQAFEQRLKAEPEVQMELDAFRLSREVIEEGIADQLRQDFGKWAAETPSQQSAKVVPLRSYRTALAIAASLLFLVVFAFLQWRTADQSYNSLALATQYHNSDLGITRSGANDSSELSQATTAVQAENYPLALSSLSAIDDTSAYYADAQLLLADVYYRTNELDEASQTVEPLLAASDNLLQEKAEWLKVLIALKAGEKNEPGFKQLLQTISTDTNHSYQPQAAQLEETLNKFWVKWVD